MTVQVADLPPWVALIVAVLLDVDVFSPNVKVLGEELLLRLPKLVDNVGLPVSSVTSPLSQYTVLLALAVIVEVPPLLGTLVGLADTVITHSPYELISSPLYDKLIVTVLLDSFWVIVTVPVLFEVISLAEALTVVPLKENPVPDIVVDFNDTLVSPLYSTPSNTFSYKN